MDDGKDADVDHGAAEGGFDDAVAHADNEKEEEGERVTACIENGDDDEEHLVNGVVAVMVLVVVEAPCHELLNDKEDDGCGNVVLHGQDIAAILDVEESPERAEDGVGDAEAAIEGEFGDLSSR